MFISSRHFRGVRVFWHHTSARAVRDELEDSGQQRGDHGRAEAVQESAAQAIHAREEGSEASKQRASQHLLGGGARERLQPHISRRLQVSWARTRHVSLRILSTSAHFFCLARPTLTVRSHLLSRLIPIYESGWKSFDVTQAVHYWSKSERNTPMHLEVWIEGERPGSYAAEMAKSVQFTNQEPSDILGKPELVLYTLNLEEFG